ncbi:hypothetical protein [Dapis sp. BLCC M229]|uniref:hypothetical protein n=1 Tax=Dapis sp. BLCC M229 TaxID=3400188 RepID=UPI003CEDBA26
MLQMRNYKSLPGIDFFIAAIFQIGIIPISSNIATVTFFLGVRSQESGGKNL